MDPGHPEAQAVAVRGGTLIAVGSVSEVLRIAGHGTRRIDLSGKTMLPGFYDAHGHFPSSGISAVHYANCNSPPMGPVERIADIVELLRAKAGATPKDQWMVGRGYDDTLLAEGRHPTRIDLDRATDEHPVCIHHVSGHLLAANSLALEAAGIDRDTTDPEGGVIRRNAKTGEPDGVLEETALRAVRSLIPPMSDDQWLAGLDHAVEEYARRGVTTAVIAGCDATAISRLRGATEGGRLPLRIVCMAGQGTPRSEPASDALRLGAVKMFHDGSIQGYTGYLSQPYHVPFRGDRSYRGYPTRPREELARMVSAAHDAGHQVAIHGNGDGAIDDILSAYRGALERHPRNDCRHRIEHCQMVREDQLDTMQELGVTPSFFVQHTYYWGDRHRSIFMGPERADRMSPLRSALKRGIRFTIHNDSPVTPINPLFSLWSGVNRLSRSGRCIGDAQRISVAEALPSVTRDAAWQNFEEDIKGTIEVGKFADLVVLDRNPLEVDPTELKDIEVLETIVGGVPVYRRDP